MTYYIAPVSLGLGDLVVSLPAVQALIDSGHDTCLITRSRHQEGLAERMQGLKGVISEDALAAKQLSESDVHINMREHPLQKNYWWGSPTFDRDFPGYKINDLLKIICKDLGIKADFDRLRPLSFMPQSHIRGRVVFVPGSDGVYKSWPMESWLWLAQKFEQYEIPVLMVGQPDNSEAVKELLPHLQWLPTKGLADALDVLSSARAVVAVDTGLMHLAVHQGTPTIALFRSHPLYFRDYPNSFAVVARPCDARCLLESLNFTTNSCTAFHGFNYRSWTCQAPGQTACMANLGCENVFAVAQSYPELFLGKIGCASPS